MLAFVSLDAGEEGPLTLLEDFHVVSHVNDRSRVLATQSRDIPTAIAGP